MEINVEPVDIYVSKLEKSALTKGLAEQVQKLRKKYGKEYDSLAAQELAILEKLGYDPVKVSTRYIMDYLMELEYFLHHNDYGHHDFDAIRAKIYDNQKVMLETYMPGLCISYICTSILYEKYHFYLTQFIPRLKEASVGVEVGFGEGFYLWVLHSMQPRIQLRGYDISPHAKAFAEEFLAAAEIPDSAYQLQYGNLIEGISADSASADCFVMAEVIEHLPNPEQGIAEMARVLKTGAYFYVSTVIDSNHMDHMVNFEGTEVLETLFRAQHLCIDERMQYRVQDEYPKSADRSVGLAYVGHKQ